MRVTKVSVLSVVAVLLFLSHSEADCYYKWVVDSRGTVGQDFFADGILASSGTAKSVNPYDYAINLYNQNNLVVGMRIACPTSSVTTSSNGLTRYRITSFNNIKCYYDGKAVDGTRGVYLRMSPQVPAIYEKYQQVCQ